jgi:hypothetical protein
MSAEGRGDQYLLLAQSTTTEMTRPWQPPFSSEARRAYNKEDRLSKKPV